MSPVPIMHESPPSPNTPRQPTYPLPHSKPLKPLKPKRHEPARRYLAGYVIDHRVTLKLEATLYGTPTPSAPDGHYLYPFPGYIEEKILIHLKSKGFHFNVIVELSGAGTPFDTIVATHWNNDFRGPLPEVAEGENERVIREWLEANGNYFTYVPYLLVAYPVHRCRPGGVPMEGPRCLNAFRVPSSPLSSYKRSQPSPRIVGMRFLSFARCIPIVIH